MPRHFLLVATVATVTAIAVSACGESEPPTAGKSPTPGADSGTSAAPDEEQDGPVPTALVVSGLVDLAARDVTVDGTRLLPVGGEVPAAEGDFIATAFGPDGSEVARTAFDLQPQADAESTARLRVAFSPAPPMPLGRLELADSDGQLLTTIEGNATVPTVALNAPDPAAGAIPVDDLEIAWTGSDADGDDLVYAVYYSPDGSTWTALTPGTDDTTFRPRSGAIQPGDGAQVLVSVSDGLNASFVLSDPFRTTG